MAVTWDPKISLGQVITLGTVIAGLIAGGFSFYYKANGTSEKVTELSEKIEGLTVEMKDINDAIDDNDKNMRRLVDGSTSGIKQEINLLRTDVVKIATEQDGHQRQIDDMKDDIRDLDAQ